MSKIQTVPDRLFIGGEFVDSASGSRIPVHNPHDGSLITEVAEAQAADIDRAVDAARSVFPAWSRTSAADRGRLLLALADAIERQAEELAELETA
ncbi:MAG: aldehyde dehydrogenase family protein, partial [Myxococcales bacterium]|nr:aldehyde dehydrogenase family protein [Myxococcales bacterium]